MLCETMPETERSPGRILILEDEKPLLDIIVMILETRGWKCVTTKDGPRVLEIARNDGPFDVVLLDLHAGESDGLEIAEQLRSRDEKLPVIVMSGTSDEDLTGRTKSIGRAAFLSKPFSIASLEKAVAQAVAS